MPESDAIKLIDDDAGFDRAKQALADAQTYFIDTEFESTRKRTTLSVVQISCGDEIFLLDALNLKRLPELGDVVLRDGVTWVLHAGLQDVELLLQCFRKPKPPRLFDTQVAWALLGPEPSVSLAYLQFKLLDIRSMKTHQADDWMRRPLPQSQLEYAASDIVHLPPMHAKLSQRLNELSRGDAVTEACHELLWPKPELPGPLSLSSFRNAWQLKPKNQAILRYLIDWYNELPNFERERAPQGKALLSIASRAPKTAKDLLRIKGVPPGLGRGHAETLVRGLTAAVKASDGSEFEQIDPMPYATFEEIELDGWLQFFRSWVSARANVAPELALPTRLMKALKTEVLDNGDRKSVLTQLDGWRKPLLEAPAGEFFAKFGDGS